MTTKLHSSVTRADPDNHPPGAVTDFLPVTDQGADPAAPPAGTHAVYSKSGGLYVEDPLGAVTGPLGSVAMGATVVTEEALDQTATAGTAATPSASDHTHGTPSTATIAAVADTEIAAKAGVVGGYPALDAGLLVPVANLPATKGLPLGLTGATAATRYVGATASGAPTSGNFAVGDFIVDQSGSAWVCTVAGTPGTWVQSGAVGPAGADGLGVPAGGTTGQVLAKIDGTDYNTEWVTPSAGGALAGRFEARFSTAYAISSTGGVPLPFDSRTDPDGCWDTTNKQYNVPHAGRFMAILYLEFTASSGTRRFPTIWRNSDAYRGLDLTGSGGSYAASVASTVVDCAAGDNIRPEIYTSASDLQADVYTYFVIAELPA